MGSPPAHGGIQILGNFTFLGVDVSVTMLDKFQQSMLEKLEVDVPVVVQRQVPWPTLLTDAWLDSGYIFCVYLAAFLDEFHTISA